MGGTGHLWIEKVADKKQLCLALISQSKLNEHFCSNSYIHLCCRGFSNVSDAALVAHGENLTTQLGMDVRTAKANTDGDKCVPSPTTT